MTMKLSNLKPADIKVESASKSAAPRLSDFKPEDVKVESEPSSEPGFLEKYIAPVGRFVDKYTGAPTRAAVDATIDSKNPLTAFTNQFGDLPENAPTGRDIAKKLGVGETRPSDVNPSLYKDGRGTNLVRGLLTAGRLGFLSPMVNLEKGGAMDPPASQVVGLGVDIGADWTNAVPGALALKGAAKTTGAAAKGLIKGTAKAAPVAVDIATGTKAASKAVEAGAEVASAVKNQFDEMTKPALAADWGKHVQTAKANGINPENLPASIEFGKDSFPSRMQRHIRETPVGEDLMTKYHAGLDEVNSAIDTHVAKVGGGKRLDQVDAGNLLVDSWKRAESKLHDGLDITYSSVQKYAPGLMLNREAAEPYYKALAGAERQAVGLARRGFGPQKEAGSNLAEIVFQLKNSKTFKQNVESLRNLGDVAFSDKYTRIGKAAPDQAKLKDLYFKLRGALVETVRKDVNPEFAIELQKNNETMTHFMRDGAQVAGGMGDTMTAPEKVYQRLIQRGDTKQLQALKANLDPQDMAAIKGAYLNDLVARNADGQILYAKTVQNLKKNQNQIKVLFSPDETQNLSDLLQLGNAFGPSVLSTSGTGGSIAFKEMFTEPAKQTMAKKALGYVMDNARGKRPAQGLIETPKETTGLLKQANEGVTSAVKTKRGPLENRLKGAQSIAPSFYEREEKKAAGAK